MKPQRSEIRFRLGSIASKPHSIRRIVIIFNVPISPFRCSMTKQQLHHWWCLWCRYVVLYVSLNSIHNAFILLINNERLSFIYIEFLISKEEIKYNNQQFKTPSSFPYFHFHLRFYFQFHLNDYHGCMSTTLNDPNNITFIWSHKLSLIHSIRIDRRWFFCFSLAFNQIKHVYMSIID